MASWDFFTVLPSYKRAQTATEVKTGGDATMRQYMTVFCSNETAYDFGSDYFTHISTRKLDTYNQSITRVYGGELPDNSQQGRRLAVKEVLGAVHGHRGSPAL